MAIVAQRLSVIRPSPTVALNSKAMEMKAAGHDVIGLAAGEPDFDTPENVADAGVAAIRAGDTKYTAPDGRPELKAAVARKLKRENGLDYEPAQVTRGQWRQACALQRFRRESRSWRRGGDSRALLDQLSRHGAALRRRRPSWSNAGRKRVSR